MTPLITAGQQPVFTMLALLVCVAGSIVTMRLFARVRRTADTVKFLWLFLAGLIGGGTIWSAQFLALLGFRATGAQGYEPVTALLSLLIVVAVTMLGFFIAARTERSALIEAGGLVVGLGAAAMHYMATSSLMVDGTVEWSAPYVAASLVLACVFGVLTTNRVARPVTRFCKYGGALAMTLTVVLVYCAGAGGLVIAPGISHSAPSEIVSHTFLAVAVLLTIGILISTATATYLIDLRSSREASDRFHHLATHDSLTGLANRTSFEARLELLISRHGDDTARTAVVVLDLDRFKEINDAQGHAAGDAVLCHVAERMAASLGEGEFVGRFGGNEFLAIKHPVYTRNEAMRFCERLRKLTGEPVAWKDGTLTPGASAGVSLFPDDGHTPADLFERAGLAMRRAKAAGRDRATCYDQAQDEANRSRSALAIDLRNALANDELELHYQPQNNAASGEIVGFEALLRWNHPLQGQISPGIFIPIAEESGLISELGAWALREACREASSWQKPYKVAVNVATAQLAAATLPRLVHEVLLDTGLPSKRLELEITESGIICDQPHALHIIRQLKALGLAIAMDDYGTGYSSLSTLQNFPFDKIKIDREFVKEVHVNKQSAAIVQATVILGASLEIPVLAEGVETEEHLNFLRKAGCHEVQGFLFGKPMPASAVRKIAGTRKPSEKDTRERAPAAPRAKAAARPSRNAA